MSKQNSMGFTLIELMVTIAVLATILAFAVPEMQLMQANSRMASVANELASDLKKTRSEAIVGRRNYSLKPNASVWNSQGWNAIVENNSSAPVLLKKESFSSKIVITEASANYNIVFLGTTGMTNTTTDVKFKICDTSTNNERGYYVLLNRFGRVLVQRHADSTVCAT